MTPRIVLLAALSSAPTVSAYPIDAYDASGIGRIEWQRLIEAGDIKGTRQPPGALLPAAEVTPRLLAQPRVDLPQPDPEFTSAVRAVLNGPVDRYAVSVLDLTDPAQPVYAEINGGVRRNPGSVGKLIVALGLFQALADLYPDDLDARRRIIRDTVVTADSFVIRDSHTVKFFDPTTRAYERHPLQIGDRARLSEYLDWMISASSNAAASMVIKQIMLLRQFGKRYPVPVAEADEFFRRTPVSDLDALLARSLEEPVTRNGFDLEQIRQGSFFTRTADARIPGTSSHATTRALMTYVLRLEQGRIVDEYSSTEIKRLMYQTERRIRYASAPALADAAVYFKSGSLFKCAPEPGFVCRKYQGNVMNLMNSVAIVEYPAHGRRLHYVVTLMSDVLRMNSAVAHQSLASSIQRLMEQRHAEAAHTATGASSAPIDDDREPGN